MAETNNLSCFRGEDIEFPFYMHPVEDISTWTIKFALKRKYSDTTMIVDGTATITDGPNGRFKCYFTATHTTQAPGTYFYDVWRITAGGNVVLSQGEMEIRPEVRF